MKRRSFLKATAVSSAGLMVSACTASAATTDSRDASGDGSLDTSTGSAACTHLEPVAPSTPEIIGPGEGEVLDDEDGHYKIRVNRLGNYWSMMELTLAPKQLLAPHTHEGYDQAVYLIEGELGFEFGGEGGQVLTGGAGSYVVKPRGLAHTFWNPSDTVTVRYIEMSANVTFEQFADAARVADGFAETDAAARAHDVTFHYEEIPRLLKEHGLTSIKGTAVKLPPLDQLPGLGFPKP
ncbi:MAG: cupin domain-containing protein [Deltaproteobacteria bacterium]|nr:cupin domain-containing protein [Deltaproteobacteria bacterium]